MPEIVIQAVGVAMEEAMLVKWLKQPGETIAVDDIVAEIDTDKATMDVISPFAGTLGPHLAAEGQVVPVGAAIVEVLDGSEQLPLSPTESDPGNQSEPPVDDEAVSMPSEADQAATPHRLSPRARRLAAEAEAEAQPAPPTEQAGGRFRELIAAKVAESWRQIPHFTVSREVNAEALKTRLGELREQAVEPVPTLTDLMLVSLARAVDGNGQAVDLGLAVATDHGVVIPVVRDVLSKTPAELASARQQAIDRARAGKLSEEDLSATPASTLSNLGNFGVDRFTGIVATGQTSLLTVGRVRPRVVADEDGETSVQLMFDATLNADHRVIDGAEAARLLVGFAMASEATTPTT